MENIIDIIQKHSLTVRCLPHEVVSYYTYREGDEKAKWVNSDGSPSKSIREVVTQHFDLEHFQKTKPPKWEDGTPEQRFERWIKNNPNGRKLLKETRTVEKGGWWYVVETKDTDSTVRFSSKSSDNFLAPTLEGAINLYLESIKPN